MKKLVLFVLAGLLLLTACSSGGKKVKKVGKTTISAPYELLIVADKEWLETDEGEVLTGLFKSDVAGVITPEPNFRVMSVNPNTFTKQFRAFANIVIVKTDSKVKSPSMSIAKDVYAHPQTIMTIVGHDGQQIAEYVNMNGWRLLDIFIDAELDREMGYLKSVYSGKVMSQAKKQFGCEIYAPQDIQSIKTGKDFFWGSSVERDNTLNICMYSYDYDTTDGLLTLENFVAHRNEFMKANIPGEHEGQYMTTQEIGLVNRYGTGEGPEIQQVRGLWRMENDVMGGSFVSYVMLDTVSHRVIVSEGFVYAPGKRKRELIRELEASVRTVRIIRNDPPLRESQETPLAPEHLLERKKLSSGTK